MQVSRECLELVPANTYMEKIIIDNSNIKAVTISFGEPSEIEIRTLQAVWIGTLPRTADMVGIIKVLRTVLGKRFVYI